MDAISALNITTRESWWPDTIDDLWFVDGALFSRLRERIIPHRGGRFIKSVFRHRPMAGGTHYRVGSNFTNPKVETLADAVHNLSFARQPIVEQKEIIQVFNKGDEAIFSILDEDLSNGLATITDMIGFALYGTNLVDPDMPEALASFIGDGVLPNWDGTVATSYASVTRSDYSRGQMNSNIFWGGKSNGAAGDVNFPLFNRAYTKSSRGAKHPNLILSNHIGVSAIINKLEPQYRFEETTDPMWGGEGYRFRGAYIMIDEHAPTSEGLNNDDNYGLGNYKTAAFANPIVAGTTGDGKNGFPNATNATNLDPGEPIWMLNTDEMALAIDDDPEFGFGLSPFMGTPDSHKVVAEINAAYALLGIGSKYQSLILGCKG